MQHVLIYAAISSFSTTTAPDINFPPPKSIKIQVVATYKGVTNILQGPFRKPDEVRAQRYKPFKPTLRVETSYMSVEQAREALKQKEWVERVIDTP